jgi:hypothetical protein
MKLRVLATVAAAAMVMAVASPALAAATTLDQHFEPDNVSVNFFTAVSYDQAQTFTAGMDGQLADVQLYCSSATGITFTVKIEGTTVSSMPDGNVLGSGSFLVNTGSNSNDGWVTFSLSPEPTLTSGVKYAIVFNTNSADYGCLGHVDGYAGGEFLRDNEAWASYFGNDVYFRTDMVTPDAAPSAPAATPSDPAAPSAAATARITQAPTSTVSNQGSGDSSGPMILLPIVLVGALGSLSALAWRRRVRLS